MTYYLHIQNYDLGPKLRIETSKASNTGYKENKALSSRPRPNSSTLINKTSYQSHPRQRGPYNLGSNNFCTPSGRKILQQGWPTQTQFTSQRSVWTPIPWSPFTWSLYSCSSLLCGYWALLSVHTSNSRWLLSFWWCSWLFCLLRLVLNHLRFWQRLRREFDSILDMMVAWVLIFFRYSAVLVVFLQFSSLPSG